MAETMIKFGYLSTSDIEKALAKKLFNPYSVLYDKTTHIQYIVKEDYSLFEVKSKVPVFASIDDAVEKLNSDTSTYAGEIISIFVNDRFAAYMVNGTEGAWTVKAISADAELSYNDLTDIPIKNVGTVPTQRVNVLSLNDGYYKINYFVSPNGNDVDSIVGNLFIIETINDVKYIKRIAQSSIFEYTVINGNVLTNQYATTEYVESKGYVTETEMDIKIQAMKLELEDLLKEYVKQTCELLVRHMIDDELNRRYASDEDIKELFN